jgi:transcriptional regulator with XRE-family HTH domain
MKLLIWEYRVAKKITLRRLSKMTGISKSALSNYENGSRYPTMLQMELIAKALRETIENLYQSDYK